VKSAVRAKKAADQAAAKEAAEAKEAALEEGDRKKEKKRMALLIGGFTGALILVFIIFKLIIGGFGGEETSYEVPNLLGKTYEEAMAMEEVKDIFEIKIEGSRVDENYEPGQIIEQDPAAGHTRKKNLVIKVWLCAEEEKDIMPDLKGEDLDSAKRTLKNLGLSLEIKEDAQFSDDYDAGKVMSTSPAAGEEIKKGDTVTLVYSKGPEEVPVNVPSFLGMSFETAKSQAQSLGLTVNEAKYEYSDQPEGNVIDQSLSNGDTVKKGTSITFTVSKGKEPPKTVSKDVSFAVPYFADDYTGSVEVSFIQDGSEIGHQNARCGDTVSCTVVGTSGTSSTVEAYFTPENDPETGEPAYDTKSASTTVYFE
jgi:serine/threonine-protein kinase